MAGDAGTRCYCLRRVNPFLGLVAVVQTPGGRALSLDGRHWQLQVLAHPPRGLWSRGGEAPGRRYFHFGAWSAQEGVTRVPLNPILDAGLMVAQSRTLVDQVQSAAADLPFPLAPELEHWLLDQESRPLALIGTALPETDLGTQRGTEWTAGGRGAERPFVSPTLSAQGVPERHGDGRRPHVQALEGLVARAAGTQRRTQWFRLDADGALGLDRGAPPDLHGRRLARTDLPPLTLSTAWAEASARCLVNDYIAWLAPYLLALPGLSAECRTELEQAATRQALMVDTLWRLYPHFINGDLLKRSRVEARIRHAAA